MKMRRFGRTEHQVSEVVLGGGWVGGILVHQDPDTMRRAWQLALDAGVNWVDTAESYGDGASETNIGWLLKEGGAARRPGISTKARLDLSSSESLASQLDRKLDASLARLQLDGVEVYQLHNRIGAERDGQQLSVADVLGSSPGSSSVADMFDRLRDDKRAGHIGFTALGEQEALNAVAKSGRFDTAQVYYNLLNPSADKPAGWGGERFAGESFAGLLDNCAAQDMGTMNIRVFAAGVIATDTRHGREVPVTNGAGLDEETRRAHAVIAALGDAYGERAQLALRFGLANQRMSCVVLGLAELSHLETALAATRMGPLPEAGLASLETLYETGFTTA